MYGYRRKNMRKIGKNHYLYRHIRLDKNQPFYIGIGTKKDKKYSTLFSEYNRGCHNYRF